MAWLRGEDPFGTVHALFGCTAAALFSAAAILGHRLETGNPQRDAHGWIGLGAFLLGALAAVAGFVILP